MTKAGMTTTEFWLSLAVLMGATVLLGLGRITGADWLGVVATVGGTYNAARAVTKATGG